VIEHDSDGATFRFPPLTASTLSGRTLRLPEELGGALNVLLIAFAREQQAVVDTWLPRLAALRAAEPRLAYYGMPTLPRALRAVSPLIAGGMRAGIPDRAARDATVVLYVDVERFCTALGLPDPTRMHVVAVDQAGWVRWSGSGAWTAAQHDALAAAVRAHRA
jgi:hypothetical protein